MLETPAPRGKVYLIGAGPGDPGLITLRGVECLRRADVILYDYLVNARILEHARSNAELICLGKHGRTRIWSQVEINQALVRLAGEGKVVA
ncbi:MAG TPA: SAM-dependent methyltransferase, partial [Pirellulaceae bacterium]|nr:SAM-dependent methyltransferase [Pirellulaceae bacterium]